MKSTRLKKSRKDKQCFQLSGCKVYTRRYMRDGIIYIQIGSCGGKISIEWAKHKNLHGLMLETQDNNLIACKFYHNCGFKIGSVDTMLYANFENNFEKAVFWYLRF